MENRSVAGRSRGGRREIKTGGTCAVAQGQCYGVAPRARARCSTKFEFHFPGISPAPRGFRSESGER